MLAVAAASILCFSPTYLDRHDADPAHAFCGSVLIDISVKKSRFLDYSQ
jgi:hypothetical protein